MVHPRQGSPRLLAHDTHRMRRFDQDHAVMARHLPDPVMPVMGVTEKSQSSFGFNQFGPVFRLARHELSRRGRWFRLF
jgi:hypothetical protein